MLYGCPRFWWGVLCVVVMGSVSVRVFAQEDGLLLSEREMDLLCLTRAYPDTVRGLETDADGSVWLMLSDGERVLYANDAPVRYTSDGVPEDATVSQSMAEPYPLEHTRAVPLEGVNPGRTRSAPFLDALYGSEKGTQKLATVQVGKEKLRVAVHHGMETAFRRVAAELEQLAAKPEVKPYLFPLGGGFFWRMISGTTRLSPHSYGIAVDLNPARGAYWRWKRSRPDYRGYPQAVVELFEANGFVWGGKWNKYDLMHFEYRPELLCKARLLQERERKVASGE